MASFKSRYDSDGCVIIPGLVCPEDFAELQVGKPYPPWTSENPDSWGVQHLMHPDLGEPIFAKYYTSDAITRTVQQLLDCKEDELQMELFNVLVNPLSQNFALGWHRDGGIPGDATEEEEQTALDTPRYRTQWNTALYTDSCLYLVPGTHKALRTPEQKALSLDPTTPPANPLDMPGAIQITLQPGETLFYNNKILHCAYYDSGQRRATLHGTMGDTRGGPMRIRSLMQQHLAWMKEPRFRDGLGDTGRKMVDRNLKMVPDGN